MIEIRVWNLEFFKIFIFFGKIYGTLGRYMLYIMYNDDVESVVFFNKESEKKVWGTIFGRGLLLWLRI